MRLKRLASLVALATALLSVAAPATAHAEEVAPDTAVPVESVVPAEPAVSDPPVETPPVPVQVTEVPVQNSKAVALEQHVETPQVATQQVVEPQAVIQSAPVADTTKPTVTIKPESIGSNGLYRSISFKLFDAQKVDKVVLNGVLKDLSNSTYSDLNGVKPGSFGGIEGLNTLDVFDVAGNVTTQTFTLDTTGPTATVKPEGTTGADGFYQKVSFKLFDNAKVVKAILNGVEKPLTPNQYSDLNGITPDTFGAVEGLNTLVLEDALGNQSTRSFTIDTIKPVINTPTAGQWVGGTHEFAITQDEVNPAKTYVEIQQLVGGKWKKFGAGSWIYNSNDLTTSFDTVTLGLTSNVQTQVKISTWDKAGNHTGKTFSVQIDNVAPSISVKPESIGSDGVFSNVSFKLHDSLSGVDMVLVNGVEKNLTNNTWSDLNNLKPGSNGAVEGENTIVVQDVAGNTASITVTLDATAPVVVDEVQEWQTKDGGRTSITLTFSESVSGLPQGWYGSDTTWTKVFYNIKPATVSFVDKAGNTGEYSLTPIGAPIVPPESTDPPVTDTPEKVDETGVPAVVIESATGPVAEESVLQTVNVQSPPTKRVAMQLPQAGAGESVQTLAWGGLAFVVFGLLILSRPISTRR